MVELRWMRPSGRRHGSSGGLRMRREPKIMTGAPAPGVIFDRKEQPTDYLYPCS